MQTLLQAFNSGDFNGIIYAALLTLIGKYASEIGMAFITWAVRGVHAVQTALDETAYGKLTEIDNRFFAKVSHAVEAMMPLADDLKNLASDGKLTEEDRKLLQERAWELFLANLNAKDILDFGMQVISGSKPRSMNQSTIAPHLRGKFLANLEVSVARMKRAV